LNVSVVEHPGLPSIPTRSPFVFGLVAVLLASAVSIGVAFAIDYADQSFRTPSEVLHELRIPVLAAVPTHYSLIEGSRANGNGNGNGNGGGNGHRSSDVSFDPTSSPIVEERG